ncbi:MAG: DUF3341 domain-containing protein [Acidobacteriota bacterium]
MAQRTLAGVFTREEDVLEATGAARREGLTILDVYTPYAVHGLDSAMALQRSRLPRVCFLLGLGGAAFKVWFEYWTTAVAWPINVGGKPWDSLPAFVPVTFEVMVLFAGVSTVVAFFLVARLRPWRRPRLVHPRVTDDRFVLLLAQTDAGFDVARVRRLLERHHATEVCERDYEEVP